MPSAYSLRSSMALPSASTADLYDAESLARLTVRRLAELNKARAQVEKLEARASLLAEMELEREKMEALTRLNDHYAGLSPALRDMGHYVSELKAYLQSVYDADLMGDTALQALSTQHCISYCIKLLELLADAGKYSNKASFGVLELATSTLCMFSQRPSAAPLLHEQGAMPVMVKLLSPLFPAVAVVNVANAAGNLAHDTACRLALRSAGGVGALVRLLRPDCEAAVQTASAAALSLLAARDMVVQDSVRYLGGIELLVDLLASSDAYLAEVARYCLLSLRHSNVKNQSEIMLAVRASAALVKDLRKLDAAADLLRYEDATPAKAAREGSAASVASSLHFGSDIKPTLAERPLTADTYLTSKALLRSSLASPSVSLLAKSLNFSSNIPAPASPLVSPRAASLVGRSIDFGSASPLSPGRAATADAADWRIGTLVEVESELLRKKHLARYSPEEVAALLEDMGFDKLDLRGFRLQRVSGARLLTLSEDELVGDMVLPRSKARKVRSLQRATHLFDRVATLPRQGRISEVELRLFLAAQGCSSSDVTKTLKLLKTLVRVDKYDFITFWDFVTGFDWIQQALRIYGITV